MLIFQKYVLILKVALSQKRLGDFFRCQNKYYKSLSWAENLNFPPKILNNLFKFSAQDSDLEYLFWQLKKPSVSSDIKPPLTSWLWQKNKTRTRENILNQFMKKKAAKAAKVLNLSLQLFWNKPIKNRCPVCLWNKKCSICD